MVSGEPGAGISAQALEDVGPVDARRLDPDQDLARAGLWAGICTAIRASAGPRPPSTAMAVIMGWVMAGLAGLA